MFFPGHIPFRPPRRKQGKMKDFPEKALLEQLRKLHHNHRPFLDVGYIDRHFPAEKLHEKNSVEDEAAKENHPVDEKFQNLPEAGDNAAPCTAPVVGCPGTANSKPKENSVCDEKETLEPPADILTTPVSVVKCPEKTGFDVRKPLETLKINNQNAVVEKTEIGFPLAKTVYPIHKDPEGILHVVIMGTPCVEMRRFHCPFTNCIFTSGEVRCVRDHMESWHKLSAVRINLACPCPPSFNDDRECHFVEYDPKGSIVLEHVRREHPVYFQVVQYLMREEKGAPVYQENVARLDCFQEHDLDKIEQTRKTTHKSLPSLLTATPRLPLPSEGFCPRVVIPTALKDEKLFYVCNMEYCNGVLFESDADIGIHMHMFHRIQPSRADYLYSCPFAPTCTWKMEREYLLRIHAKACAFLQGKRTCSAEVTEVSRCADYADTRHCQATDVTEAGEIGSDHFAAVVTGAAVFGLRSCTAASDVALLPGRELPSDLQGQIPCCVAHQRSS